MSKASNLLRFLRDFKSDTLLSHKLIELRFNSSARGDISLIKLLFKLNEVRFFSSLICDISSILFSVRVRLLMFLAYWRPSSDFISNVFKLQSFILNKSDFNISPTGFEIIALMAFSKFASGINTTSETWLSALVKTGFPKIAQVITTTKINGIIVLKINFFIIYSPFSCFVTIFYNEYLYNSV